MRGPRLVGAYRVHRVAGDSRALLRWACAVHPWGSGTLTRQDGHSRGSRGVRRPRGAYGLTTQQGALRLPKSDGGALTFSGGSPERTERFTLTELPERVGRLPDRTSPQPAPTVDPTAAYRRPARWN